jgi:hypothetical protein
MAEVYGAVGRRLAAPFTGNVPPLRFNLCPSFIFTFVSGNTTDFYLQKTDEELLFVVRNPSYYHPDLVTTAQQELRRRGVALAPAAATLSAPTASSFNPAPLTDDFDLAPPARGAGAIWLAVLVAVLTGGAIYWFGFRPASPAAGAAASAQDASAKAAADTLLVSVPSSALPNYDGAVDRCVTQQLKRVPARELKQAQAMRQYRELTRRFWAAQALTEHLTNQARQGKNPVVLLNQMPFAHEAWGRWNKATVYSYKFEPTMADHFDRMARVAQQQQEGLHDLAASLAVKAPLESANTARRDSDVQDLLAGLVPASPVTSQPYHAQVRRVRL